MSTTENKQEKKELDHDKHNVRVSGGRSKFVYADVSKHLLAGGEPFVEISALGVAIADAVAVAEMLKNQGMVTVSKIETSRGIEGAKRANTDKISIHVVKAKGFDAIYQEQQAERDAKEGGGQGGEGGGQGGEGGGQGEGGGREEGLGSPRKRKPRAEGNKTLRHHETYYYDHEVPSRP
eukprot:182322_1